MKKPLIGADLILSLGYIAYLYFDIKSDGDGSFLKGLEKMTSDGVFWYIVLALAIVISTPHYVDGHWTPVISYKIIPLIITI